MEFYYLKYLTPFELCDEGDGAKRPPPIRPTSLDVYT